MIKKKDIIKRSIWIAGETLTDLWTYDAEFDVYVSKIFAIETLRFHKDGSIDTEMHYYMTNLRGVKALAKNLLNTVREHWSIENKLHHIKDRSWNEDKHYLKRGNLPEMFSGLLSIALNCLRLWFNDTRSFVQRAYFCADNLRFTCEKLRAT